MTSVLEPEAEKGVVENVYRKSWPFPPLVAPHFPLRIDNFRVIVSIKKSWALPYFRLIDNIWT